jgi:hypothetical protein
MKDYSKPENWHPAAECFPLLGLQELKELADDIKKNGLIQPITLLDGLVLDGRNRAKGCASRGVQIRTEDWKGDDPVAFVISLNLRRRHLTAGQLAMAAANITNLYAPAAKERQTANLKRGDAKPVVAIVPQRDAGKAREKAAKSLGASPRYTQDAIAIREYSPKLAAEVLAAEKTIPEAKREMKKTLPPVVPKPRTEADRYRQLHSFVQHNYSCAEQRIAELPGHLERLRKAFI